MKAKELVWRRCSSNKYVARGACVDYSVEYAVDKEVWVVMENGVETSARSPSSLGAMMDAQYLYQEEIDWFLKEHIEQES